ncbi:hypothetical protein Q4Q34_06865 [Flavivirga abyssicola]|uniref:hypothetical protein n=1 Tax=Flavivirga abyssicola TaxID=3063533 RepID=UPI0026E0BE4A|nr:hypothetical protein [Flavivirga sp. MEBiC07777]WVK14748.1 hypothetical protein Q4Q34_06865 [Flavivirga sp. MEBiC07777]
MKKLLIYIFSSLLFAVIITSCVDDDADPTIVSTSDLTLEAFSSVIVNDTIGTVFGTSNAGSVNFSILNQTPSGTLKIDENGNLIIADAAPFTAGNSTINAEVVVSKENTQKVANIEVIILTCPEITPFVGTDLIFTSSFSDVSFVEGEAQTGNTCAVVYTGTDPLFTFLDCDTETSITVLLSPSVDDPTIGTLNIKRQAYGCSDTDNGFEVEGEGEYDVDAKLFTFDYTLYLNGTEWDTGSAIVSNESDGDNDGDGITNGDERDNGSDEEDPCDPQQPVGYTGYDPDNFVWGDADCDGDGQLNFDEFENGTDPYEFSAGPIDTDGDGVSDDDEILNGTDENDPCDPAQSSGYTGYDNTNAIWLAADCDSDGIINDDEDFDGTDPYTADGSCTNNADTLLWEGNLVSEDDLATTSTAVGTSGCGTLDLTGDWVPVLSCASDLPNSRITFTPDVSDDGTGTVALERQTYTPCDGIAYEIEGSGTYDENQSLIIINWKVFDIDFSTTDPEIEGTTEIKPE